MKKIIFWLILVYIFVFFGFSFAVIFEDNLEENVIRQPWWFWDNCIKNEYDKSASFVNTTVNNQPARSWSYDYMTRRFPLYASANRMNPPYTDALRYRWWKRLWCVDNVWFNNQSPPWSDRSWLKIRDKFSWPSTTPRFDLFYVKDGFLWSEDKSNLANTNSVNGKYWVTESHCYGEFEKMVSSGEAVSNPTKYYQNSMFKTFLNLSWQWLWTWSWRFIKYADNKKIFDWTNVNTIDEFAKKISEQRTQSFDQNKVWRYQAAINIMQCDKIMLDGKLWNYTIKSFCNCFCIQPDDERCTNLNGPESQITTCWPNTQSKLCINGTWQNAKIIWPLCPCGPSEDSPPRQKTTNWRQCPSSCIPVKETVSDNNNVDYWNFKSDVPNTPSPIVDLCNNIDYFLPDDTATPQQEIWWITLYDISCTLKNDILDFKKESSAPFCCMEPLDLKKIKIKKDNTITEVNSCCVMPDAIEEPKCTDLTWVLACWPWTNKTTCTVLSWTTSVPNVPICPCGDGESWQFDEEEDKRECPCVEDPNKWCIDEYYKNYDFNQTYDQNKDKRVASPKTCSNTNKLNWEATHCKTPAWWIKEICPCGQNKDKNRENSWTQNEKISRSCPCEVTTEQDLYNCTNLEQAQEWETCGSSDWYDYKECCFDEQCIKKSAICVMCENWTPFVKKWWKRICPCKDWEKRDNTKKKCVCDPAQQCCWIELNTQFPWIWRCILFGDTNDVAETWTNQYGQWNTTSTVNILNAFPFLMQSLQKIFMTVFLLICFGMIIYAGVKMTTYWYDTAASSEAIGIIKKVAIAIALIWTSWLILYIINPNFFR